MTKAAHITSRPEYTIGDRVLGLCGKKFTVKQKWDDIPPEKPICRPCVDRLLSAATQADDLIGMVRIHAAYITERMVRLGDVLLPADFPLDLIAEEDGDFQGRQEAKAERRAEQEKAQQTCICRWVAPTDNEPARVLINEDCPIHGDNPEDDSPIPDDGAQ